MKQEIVGGSRVTEVMERVPERKMGQESEGEYQKKDVNPKI